MTAPPDLDEFTGRTVLVTGGGGFLGRTVVRRLRDVFPGRVVSVQRRPEQAPGGLHLGTATHADVVADLRDDEWHDILVEADYVLWLAALRDHGASREIAERENLVPLRRAVDVMRTGRLRRFVFASTISAVDQGTTGPPRPLTDDTMPQPTTGYGAAKLACERLLAASGVPHTVLRLPFLYGPGFRADSFLAFYRRVASTPVLGVLPFTADLSLLHTGDVADLTLHVLAEHNREQADDGPYLVADGPPHEVADLVGLVARLCGRTVRPLPPSVGRAASRVALASRAIPLPAAVATAPLPLALRYWSHAAFTRGFFTVDARRFHAAFPGCRFVDVTTGMAAAFAGAAGRRYISGGSAAARP
jgi:UDP-glucose 4-epimerase